MDRWDVLIILLAGYVAVMSLVRMMAQRRNYLFGFLREQIVQQHKNRKPQVNQPPSDTPDDADRGAA